MLVSIACVVLTVHFARVVAGNLYRAMPAFVVPAEKLAQMLDKTPEQITWFERCRFYGHCLLSS